MIKAFIFDLDGTLVETEHLKALSYAKAAQELCPDCATEQDVIQAFHEVVGKSRQEVAQYIVQKFHLEDAAAKRMAEFGVSAPWQAFVQIRLQIFDKMIEDPQVIQESKCTHAIDLLHKVRQMGFRTALTTTSSCPRTQLILKVLDLRKEFEFVATADDVEHTKPDPEIYHLVLGETKLPAKECVALEDSLPGIQSALAAGVWCIAVPTDFTRDSVHNACPLDPQWIVDDPAKLQSAAMGMVEERKEDQAQAA